MGKIFNIAGPCNPERHYMLSEKDRVWHADIICPTPPRAWWAMPYNGGES